MWLEHNHFLSLCLTVEGMDDIWVMDMQNSSSLVELTACSQEELLLHWGIVLGSSSAPWMCWFLLPGEVLMGAGCVPVCEFSAG